MSRLLILCGGQALAYLVLVVNMRAITKTKWVAATVTEVIYALMSFYLLHRIVEAKTGAEAAAYATGCVLGMFAGMWTTKHWGNE